MLRDRLTHYLRKLLGRPSKGEQPAKVHCATHGEADATFVCQHVVEGLIRKERVGFFWSVEEPENPHPDAWCEQCEERVKLTGGEWEGEALEHLKPKILCAECYGVAKIFHMGGKPWN